MKSAIIGFGSIGARHAEILKKMGLAVSVVSSRDDVPYPVYKNIDLLFDTDTPDYLIISNATELHYSTFEDIKTRGFRGILLIEKPVSGEYVPMEEFCPTFVAYQLRFHRVLQEMRRICANNKLLACNIYTGSFLPDWRPGQDYRKVSSSSGSDGGVLRELSHEWDYLFWISGQWESVSTITGHHSTLEIQRDDVTGVLLETKRCPVATVQLNYLDRIGRREIIMILENKTIHADLIKNTLLVNGKKKIYSVERNETFQAMHEAVLNGKHDQLCSLAEGLEILKFVNSAEHSFQTGMRQERVS
jgi:predicted dehydrogenase